MILISIIIVRDLTSSMDWVCEDKATSLRFLTRPDWNRYDHTETYGHARVQSNHGKTYIFFNRWIWTHSANFINQIKFKVLDSAEAREPTPPLFSLRTY